MKIKTLFFCTLLFTLLFSACSKENVKSADHTIYTNVLAIQGGVITSYFAKMAEGMASMNKDPNKKAEAQKKVQEMKKALTDSLPSIVQTLNNTFDSVYQADSAIYNLLFRGELAQQGVQLAESSPWPSEHPRLNKPLSKQEYLEYIHKVMAELENAQKNKMSLQNVHDIQDPFLKKVMEFSAWAGKMDKLVEQHIKGFGKKK
jgi:hypothetical protein